MGWKVTEVAELVAAYEFNGEQSQTLDRSIQFIVQEVRCKVLIVASECERRFSCRDVK